MIEPQDSSPKDPFIASLVRLAPKSPEDDRNRAALAALRRGLGRTPGSVPEMFRYVTPSFRASTSRRQEDNMFIVASLFGLYPRHSASTRSPLQALQVLKGERDSAGNRVLNPERESSIDKRVMALLNAGIDELPTHLRHIIHLLNSSERQPAINYEKLLRDLGSWDAPDRWVQRNWARDWWADYRPTDDQADASGEEADTTADEE